MLEWFPGVWPLATVILSLLLVMAIAQPAQAAIPPRSRQSLQEMAAFILVGTVGHINAEVIEHPQGSDWYYTVTITVEEIERDALARNDEAAPETIPVRGKPLVVHYTQVKERPSGWTGPVGQYQHPTLGECGRLFLTLDPRDRWQLIEPNGWERLS